jgi:hypothetical protein
MNATVLDEISVDGCDPDRRRVRRHLPTMVSPVKRQVKKDISDRRLVSFTSESLERHNSCQVSIQELREDPFVLG